MLCFFLNFFNHLRTHFATVFDSPFEKTTVGVDLHGGVFSLDSEMLSCMASDPTIMGKLLFNPLSPLHTEVEHILNERVELFL